MVARVEVLPAAETDMEAINAIYNHYVPASDCTMETEPVSLESRLVWFYEHRDRYPILVARFEGGRRVGLPLQAPGEGRIPIHGRGRSLCPGGPPRNGGRYRPAHRLGQGREGHGLHSVVAVINAQHTASLGLHRKVGFQDVALIREAGYKSGRWIDIRFMQLML